MPEKIYYSDEEWDKLTDIVFRMRASDPVPALTTLVERAMSQMPRKRKLTTQTLGPLLERLSEKMQNLLDAERRISVLTAQLQTAQKDHTTREQVLKSLTDNEIVSLFGPRVLHKVAEILTKPVVEQVCNVTSVAPKRKAVFKVGIVGLKNEGQRHDLDNKTDLNVSVISIEPFDRHPPVCDLYIVWTDFVSHGSSDHIPSPVFHSGGLNRMAGMINQRYDEWRKTFQS